MGYYDETEIGILNKKAPPPKPTERDIKEWQDLKRKTIKWIIYITSIGVTTFLVGWKIDWFWWLFLTTPFAIAIHEFFEMIENELKD